MKESKDTEVLECQKKLREQETNLRLLREEYERLLEVERTQVNVETSVDDIAKLQEVLGESERSRQEFFQQLQEAKAKIVALEQANREVQNRSQRLEAQSTQVSRLSAQLREENDKLKKENEELQDQCQAFRAQDSRRLSEQLQGALKDNEDLQEALKNAVVEHKQLEEELQKSQDVVAALQQQLTGAQAWIQQLQSKPSTDDNSWKVLPREVQVFEGEHHIRGRGAWGYVAEGSFRGQVVAVKCAHELLASKSTIERVHREIRTMSVLRHPNLVLFIGAVFEYGRPPMIITELLEINLRKAYETGRLGDARLTTMFRDIACALNYLHNHCQPIIHRDVSSANVLLEGIVTGWKAKLSDFGSANVEKFSKTLGEGAFVYAAPEMFPQAPGIKRPPQTPKVDVYSYGVLLCEVSLKKLPEDSEEVHGMVEQVRSKWPYMHKLISSCIAWNHADRPTMAAVIQDLNKIIPPKPY